MRAPGSVLVLGGSGMLGAALGGALRRKGLPHVLLRRHELDLARPDTFLEALRSFSPRAVVNAAAFTDVARAEDPALTPEVFLLNRDAPATLARDCRVLGAAFVHISTDYVFDGTKTSPYREVDPPNPLQVYGRSKLEGEQRALDENASTLVVRTSTLFGSTAGRKLTYVDAILAQARRQASIEVVLPPVSSPTYAPDLAAALVRLLEVGATGIVHASNAGACSRLDLARAIVEEAGLGDRVEVRCRPEPAGSLGRPAYSVLDNARLASLLGSGLRPWREALRSYVRDPSGASTP